MKYYWNEEDINEFRAEEQTVCTLDELEDFEAKLSDYVNDLISETFTEGDDALEMYDSLIEAVYIDNLIK